MKKWPIALLVIPIVVGGYLGRGYIRDRWDAMHAPNLPQAQAFDQGVLPPSQVQAEQPSPIEGGAATSEHYVLQSSPPATTVASKVDPMAVRGPLPPEVNLAVPFTIQAPDQKWVLPYEEACEEASILMVDAYYKGKTGTLPVLETKQTIDQMVVYENKTFGDYMHTTAAQTGKMAIDFFKMADAIVVPIQDERDMKRLLANGFPIVVPAAGRDLGNPNFSGAGPVYHNLVVKGYTKDGHFITNDPGTRKGADYVYTFDTLLDAMHDYNAEDIHKGAKLVLVLIPQPKP